MLQHTSPLNIPLKSYSSRLCRITIRNQTWQEWIYHFSSTKPRLKRRVLVKSNLLIASHSHLLEEKTSVLTRRLQSFTFFSRSLLMCKLNNHYYYRSIITTSTASIFLVETLWLLKSWFPRSGLFWWSSCFPTY